MRWKAPGRAMNLSWVPAQGDAAFCDALFGVRELEVVFSIVPFLSIDAVGSELWTALHEYISGDTGQSAFDNSPGMPFLTMALSWWRTVF